MYRNIKEYELRYSDVDLYDNIKLSSLLSLLQESACRSADELGFGYNALSSKGLGFIIVNWYIELERGIKLGDKLCIHTWPLRPRHLIFLRDSELYIADKKVGVATARWCMINTVDYSLAPSDAFFGKEDMDKFNCERSIEFSAWKIPAFTDCQLIYSKKVRYSDYDHYFHVNNTKYADYLMDVFEVDELRNRELKSVQITYVKQCRDGETIDIYRKHCIDYDYIEGRVNGELRVQLKVSFYDV